MKRQASIVVLALLFTIGVPVIGYVSLGILPTLLFLTGYLAGFILWLSVPAKASFASIKVIYWITFGLFLLHRVEERIAGFFSVLSEITGVPVPKAASFPIIILLVLSVVAWLIGPFGVSRRYAFGYYLVWTFFASMGFTELAHFIIPLFVKWSDWYFPGMISVFLLAPAAWYGMWRFSKVSRKDT